MKEEWKAMSFETLPHKDTGTYLLGEYDDVQTLLDDHIMKTEAILSSEFCKPFEKACREWEGKLTYIQDSIDQILNVLLWLGRMPLIADFAKAG